MTTTQTVKHKLGFAVWINLGSQDTQVNGFAVWINPGSQDT
jgi:hypothetical protein